MFIELGQHENPDPECGSMCLNSHCTANWS